MTLVFGGRLEAAIPVPSGVGLSVTNSGGGPTTVSLTAGTYYWTAAGGVASLLAHLATKLNAARPPTTGAWTVALSLSTGQVTIDCTDEVAWSISWSDTNLRDLLGFDANIAGVTTAQTAPKQARALWFPDCPLMLAGDPGRAPKTTDARSTVSPTGAVYTIKGNAFFRQQQPVYSHVPQARIREMLAPIANASWERFCDDTQLAEGHAWFAPGAPVQLYDHTGALVGLDARGGAGVAGWAFSPAIVSIEPMMAITQWAGLWELRLPDLVASL